MHRGSAACLKMAEHPCGASALRRFWYCLREHTGKWIGLGSNWSMVLLDSDWDDTINDAPLFLPDPTDV